MESVKHASAVYVCIHPGIFKEKKIPWFEVQLPMIPFWSHKFWKKYANFTNPSLLCMSQEVSTWVVSGL